MTRAPATSTTTTVDPGTTVLRLPALEIRQGPERRLYTFAVDGKLIPQIATVSRVRRDNLTLLHGYQRPEGLAHVASIRRYIESDPSPMLPNAIVIAFDQRVHFTPADSGSAESGYARHGYLEIPTSDSDDTTDRAGFIVDGQQRCAAIRDARVESFPICVTAFITTEHADQRSQFILVNSTKALPKGLIHELLPGTAGILPGQLMARQLPATILERLNFEPRSPLHRRIQTPTNPTGVIKDNSILRMLEHSLSDGALYNHYDGELPNLGSMIALVANYWRAVAEVFPEAWEQKGPRYSRLLHGAGIISMGYVMDEIARPRPAEIVTTEEFITELKTIKDDCRWTEGTWQFGEDSTRRWNDLQNTRRDVQLLTDYLLTRYRTQARAAEDDQARRQESLPL